MHELFMQSFYLLERRRVGMACSLSRTRFVFPICFESPKPKHHTQITEQSSSFIGPLLVGLISDVTGNIRYAFFFLVFMIWLAVPILMSVDVDRGRKDAQEYEYHSSERS